jgi:BCCT family betaine/carnitine transporter
MFHWGPVGWAIFCLPTIAIAYAFYMRGEPHLRLSSGCLPFLPGGVNSTRGRLIDFIYMVNLIGGSATSLGLTAPMIAALFAKLSGVPHNFALEAAVLVVSVMIFAASSWLGLERGFKRLADANTWIALTLLGYVLAVGPTLFILHMGTNSLGLMVQDFVRMVTWTDPVKQSGFVESWTVFYWAWWVAYGPFVALFATRISRGRTLRELILGLLVFGTLGASVFIVLGNYALNSNSRPSRGVTTLDARAFRRLRPGEVLGTLPLPPRHGPVPGGGRDPAGDHLRLSLVHAGLRGEPQHTRRRRPGALEPTLLGNRDRRPSRCTAVRRRRRQGRAVGDRGGELAAAGDRRAAGGVGVAHDPGG